MYFEEISLFNISFQTW